MEQFFMTIIAAMGIPSSILGLLIWKLQRNIEKREIQIDEQQRNQKELMLMMMQTGRANNALAEATARAVQRIPNAHCNGDMTRALEYAAKVQEKEQKFLARQGIDHIFNDI